MCYLDEFDVVFDGGSLLPDRATQRDNRWDGVPTFSFGENEDHVEPRKQRRAYNKVDASYWRDRKATGRPPEAPGDATIASCSDQTGAGGPSL